MFGLLTVTASLPPGLSPQQAPHPEASSNHVHSAPLPQSDPPPPPRAPVAKDMLAALCVISPCILDGVILLTSYCAHRAPPGKRSVKICGVQRIAVVAVLWTVGLLLFYYRAAYLSLLLAVLVGELLQLGQSSNLLSLGPVMKFCLVSIVKPALSVPVMSVQFSPVQLRATENDPANTSLLPDA